MASSGFSQRLQLLQERDKELRESRHRQTNIETAKAVKGTCEDMCPEIERLFREETNQLSPLEMTADNKPDPHAMVKEYRRAGADQSEPLPHEMRPGSVLKRTMDYLCINIMDKILSVPGIAGDWYDFLWSRTRAIRKDITQQHLCDLTSVELLEKCARFHVYCAGTMIEEDLSIFDPKINDENLRKCIQSLKDFYHDLKIKEGIICLNESEFRGYDILLNLADSDILREVSHLRREVRDSSPVAFAITCHFAMSSNNFVRFFSLASKASFLESCLLHRYFNRVRCQAVRVMRKSFTMGNQTEFYPGHQLCHQLGFDGITQMNDFCSQLSIPFDGTSVHLTREKGIEAAFPSIPSVKSILLVESKRTTSIGEVVNGGPLPANPYKQYPLNSSFREDGSLKPNAMMIPSSPPVQAIFPAASRTLFGQSDQTPAFGFLPGFSVPKREEPVVSDEQINRLSSICGMKILDSHLNSLIKQCMSESVSEAKREENVAMSLFDRILGFVVKSMTASVVESVVRDETEIKRFQERRAFIRQFSIKAADEIITETVKGAIKEVYNEDFRQNLIRVGYLLTGSLIKESFTEIVKELAQEVIDEEIIEMERKVLGQLHRREQRIGRKYFKKWQEFYQKRKKYQQLRQDFPACSWGSGNFTVVCQPTSPSKSSHKKSSVGNKRKSFEAAITPPTGSPVTASKKTKTNQVKEEPAASLPRRPLSTDALAEAKATIALYANADYSSRLARLRRKIEEEKKRDKQTNEIVDCLARSMAFLENQKDS